MAGTQSSRAWLSRHVSDPYVHDAKRQGYRSRAAFKLLELQKRDGFLKPGMKVLDLGAAPGGWSQVASQIVGQQGRVVALDKLPMDSLFGVDILEGDFEDPHILKNILDCLNGKKVDLLMSDMAPNMSGVKAVDQPRSLYLAELALDMAGHSLKPGGDFLVKVFQGEGFQEYCAMLKEEFKKIWIRKPKASRLESREVYLLAREYLGKQ